MDIPITRRGQKGTTDGTFLRKMGIDAVMVGPGDSIYNHKANERVPIVNIEKAVEIYLTIMLSNTLQ